MVTSLPVASVEKDDLLIRKCALLRVRGKDWSAIGEELNRDADLLSELPFYDVDGWDRAYDFAEKQFSRELMAETLIILRKQMHGPNAREASEAAKAIMRWTIQLEKRRPLPQALPKKTQAEKKIEIKELSKSIQLMMEAERADRELVAKEKAKVAKPEAPKPLATPSELVEQQGARRASPSKFATVASLVSIIIAILCLLIPKTFAHAPMLNQIPNMEQLTGSQPHTMDGNSMANSGSESNMGNRATTGWKKPETSRKQGKTNIETPCDPVEKSPR